MIKELQDIQSVARSDWERFATEQAGAGPAWLHPLRQAAFSRFAEFGFPTRRDEEWRYTPVAPLTDIPFRLAGREQSVSPEQAAQAPFGNLPCARLVFVNGRYASELSSVGALPQGVKAGSLTEALATDAASVEPHLGRLVNFENHVFAAWNAAFLRDGAFVAIPRGVVIETPIQLLYLATAPDGPTVSHPRALIVAGENSQASVIEIYAGLSEETYLTNAVTEIALAENAVLDHVRVNQESRAAFHVGVMQAALARTANFTSQNIALGGQWARCDHGAVFLDEGGEATLNGLYLADGSRLVDNHTVIDHAQPHCDSHELYKGILGEKARGVFNGKIFVRKDAQKTDAKQTNMTLLLSKEAQINTKPQLEIFADDVKCTHGATIGQLRDEAIFYLRARGIGEAEARNLLIHAFANEIIARVKFAPLRESLERALLDALPQEAAR